MELTTGINNKISERDFKAINSLFILHDPIAIRHLSQVSFENVLLPFGNLLHKQKTLNETQNYTVCESIVLEMKQALNDEWMLPIFKTALKNLFIVGNSEKEKAAKIFQQLFRDSQDTSSMILSLRLLTFNYLIYFYDTLGNHKMAGNLFSVFSPELNKSKESKIFVYYQARHFVRSERYSEAYKRYLCLYRSRNAYIKNLVAFELFLLGIMHGKCPQKTILQKHNLEHAKDLFTCVLTGNVKRYDEEILKVKDLIIKIKMTRFVMVEMQQVTYINFLKTLYQLGAQQNKLYLDFIVRCCQTNGYDCNEMNILSIIMALIEKKGIKGYLNLTHRVIVLSKNEPFSTIKI